MTEQMALLNDTGTTEERVQGGAKSSITSKLRCRALVFEATPAL
ncbi:MAG: hypothetical protein ACI841_003451 [Planctomycetota bacterium]|jgi:hypothetical protein